MRFFAVALSLPSTGYYRILHKHSDKKHCRWEASDPVGLDETLEVVEAAYQARGALHSLLARRAFYNQALTLEQALLKVTPYYIVCDAENRRRVNYVTDHDNNVEILGPAGTVDEEFGVRRVAIAKGANRMLLLPWVIERLEAAGVQTDGGYLDSLEGRSNLEFLKVLSETDRPALEEGYPKIVNVPKDASVRLSRNSTGEFVSEIPRVWS